MKQLALIVLFALLPVSVFAQGTGTGPVSTNSVILWSAPSNAADIAQAQSLEYRVYIDQATTFTVLGTKTCGAPQGTDVIATCQQNVPASLVPVLNVIGTHNVRLTAYSPTEMLESDQSLPFVLKSPPAAPTGLRLTK